ncbi:hypothetical protein FHR32_008371 [Streptosporangium album]|uniref:Uncharacterized protein n=1 Tax=Streptosporangium album TaxID=47479 RepID=A0A7W7S506_9ACTN|nr:hypothetical protein [Streptosporangium album]MBB4943970.1 hypothetical protein [Streptosporangium album]
MWSRSATPSPGTPIGDLHCDLTLALHCDLTLAEVTARNGRATETRCDARYGTTAPSRASFALILATVSRSACPPSVGLLAIDHHRRMSSTRSDTYPYAAELD